jgi:hypothetical protein
MIAFVTTCKGRTQHLEQTLPANIRDNASYPDCRFVVLNYNSQDNLLPFVASHFPDEIASGRLVVYTYLDHPVFRMAHAKNLAHRLGMREGADILVNLDADNLTGRDFAQHVAEGFDGNSNVFLWARMIKEGENRTARGCNGRLAVSRDAFLRVGGYDERFETWSPDDKDFHLRLRRVGIESREIDRQYLGAILHTDKMRFREYPHAVNSYHEFPLEESGSAVVNKGNIGTGRVYRNFDFQTPIDIKPVPARIFGIGLHKTGTTSLHFAFRMLGISSSGHWHNAHWAKAIWLEITRCGWSYTLEKHYALSDLPIPILFRQLDRCYPGSKFILTIRQEEKWLRSVRNHWDPEKNRFRHQWDTDPFTHKIHKEVYGQKGFNPAVMLERYRRHNMEVTEYFRDRPGDLLVMDLDQGAGWPELCQFLDMPEPQGPYPHRYATYSI